MLYSQFVIILSLIMPSNAFCQRFDRRWQVYLFSLGAPLNKDNIDVPILKLDHTYGPPHGVSLLGVCQQTFSSAKIDTCRSFDAETCNWTVFILMRTTCWRLRTGVTRRAHQYHVVFLH